VAWDTIFYATAKGSVADAAPRDDAEIDPYWRVRFNVPRDRIEGWLLYGK
jgi:hypothetical protein